MIPYGCQSLDDKDIESVVSALQSEFITQGNRVEKFESMVENYCKVDSAVALSSGTMGLYLCCQAMGLQKGGLLWTSPNSFVASANCANYCGADVDFVDIDITTGNIDVSFLAEKLQLADLNGRLPDIVIPVHYAGHSCDMKAIFRLAKQYGFRVIEDACHALGGSYKGEMVGSCKWSDATVFSFHPVKSITTAEGGMVVSNDIELTGHIRTLANSGVSCRAENYPWYREMKSPGINARMSELHASLGISQIKKLDQFVEKRRSLAENYIDALSSVPISLPQFKKDIESAWHLFVVHIREGRDQLCSTLHRAGIDVNVHYVPIHLHSWYREKGFLDGDFPRAEAHFKTAISLPLYPELTISQLDYVITTLSGSLRNVA